MANVANVGVLIPPELVGGVDADSFRLVQDPNEEGRYFMDFLVLDPETETAQVVGRVRVRPPLLLAIGDHVARVGSADLSKQAARITPTVVG